MLPTTTPAAYYSNARTEIVPLLPKKSSRILEIGCGTGATIAYLKQQNLCQWAAGLEIMPEAAAAAKQVADVVWQENIETFTLPLEPQSLDVILCMDVLEHLVDPWAVMQKLTPLLSKDGVIIASIPNIQHHRVMKDLILRSKFEYQNDGILDRTHLRFFTRDSAVSLMTSTGLTLASTQDLHYLKKKHWWKLNNMLQRVMPNFFAVQYLLCVKK